MIIKFQSVHPERIAIRKFLEVTYGSSCKGEIEYILWVDRVRVSRNRRKRWKGKVEK